MKFSYPIRGDFEETQGFKYKSHWGLDTVPMLKGKPYPADLYPITEAEVRYSYTEYNGKKAVVINLETPLDEPATRHLKELGDIPKDYNGKVKLLHIYMHGLKLYETEKGKRVTPNDRIMQCGNTGQVSSGGVPVPEEEKGVPPYRGLHLHLQCELYRENHTLIGYIDPYHLLNYKPKKMIGYKKVNDSIVYVLVGNTLVPIADWEAFTDLGGSENTVIELSENQFSKYDISTKTLFKLNA